MSATSLVRGVFLHMQEIKSKTKKSASLDEVLEKFAGDPGLALIKADGKTPYEYNRKPATRKDRLKQALSSVRSAFSAGTKADPRWVATCDAITTTLNLGSGGQVAPPIEADAENIANMI